MILTASHLQQTSWKVRSAVPCTSHRKKKENERTAKEEERGLVVNAVAANGQ